MESTTSKLIRPSQFLYHHYQVIGEAMIESVKANTATVVAPIESICDRGPDYDPTRVVVLDWKTTPAGHRLRLQVTFNGSGAFANLYIGEPDRRNPGKGVMAAWSVFWRFLNPEFVVSTSIRQWPSGPLNGDWQKLWFDVPMTTPQGGRLKVEGINQATVAPGLLSNLVLTTKHYLMHPAFTGA